MKRNPALTLVRLCVVVCMLRGGQAVFGEVECPSGTQDFEAMNVGDSVLTLTDWVVVNTSVPASLFTVVAANDVNGTVMPRGSSTKRLRVDDQDAGNVQNRFYSLPVVSSTDVGYVWEFYVNLETLPPPDATVSKPRITIQHRDNASTFQNAWGLEFTQDNVNLIVTGIGGTAASASLYDIQGDLGVKNWVKLTLCVNFTENEVGARANDGSRVSLPIALQAGANKQEFRFCYRGEGTGNVQRMLIDDLTVDCTSLAAANCSIPSLTRAGLAVMAVLVLGITGLVIRRRGAAVA